MTVSTLRDAALDGLRADAPAIAGPLAALREKAEQALGSMRLPGPKDEAWRFVNLAPIKQQAFAPAATAIVTHAQLADYLLPESAHSRLVFVNGHYAPALSSLEGLESVTVGTLSAASGVPDARLGTLAGASEDVFTALNSRMAEDGALVVFAPDSRIATPIHLLFVNAPQPTPAASYARALVVVGANSEATVVEDHVSLGGGVHLTDAVSELAVGDGARLTHLRVQREATDAFHLGRSAARLGRDARYEAVLVNFGGRTARLDAGVTLAAEGAEAKLFGLTLITGEQESDTHSSITHARPHGRSEQLNKCIAGGRAHGVFNGRVHVARGAQGTDSAQSSRNLLLSPRARVDAKPELEIFADDVKCSHGATVGQLEADELFYLQSRGLSQAEAYRLLLHGFAGEVLERIPVPSLRDRLEATVLAHTIEEDA